MEEREVEEREMEEREMEERKVEEREMEERRLGVVGLHTCGSLAPASIKLFFSTRSAKFICNVGCCYHHLPEEFYTNPFLDDDNGGKETPGDKISVADLE
jgi:hypothetical protein